MNSSWKLVEIGELGKIVTGKTPSTKVPEYFGKDYPFITPSDMKGNKTIYSTERFLSQEGAELLKNFSIPKDSVCVSCIGWQMGKVVLSANRSFTNQQINTIIPNETIDPDFLFYTFKTRRDELLSIGSAVGVRTPIINKSAFSKLKVSLPVLSVQNKIASILSPFDDLIENNTRRIQILEEMAQRIYREWFVHFRFPGYENVKMIESELGEIPGGWEVKSVGELVEFNIGGGWGKEKLYKKYEVPAYVIRGTDIPNARYNKIDNCPFRYHTISNFKSRKLYPNDIIFEVSGGSKDQPLGRALLVSKHLLNTFTEDVICASFCKLIRPNKKEILPELLYLNFLEIYQNKSIMKYQVQSTGLSNFKFSIFLEDQQFLKPLTLIQNKFADIIKPMFEKIQVLGKQSSNLRQTRDLLLPKLMSGKIDIESLDIDTGEPQV